MKPSFVCCRKPILQTKMQHKGSSSCTLLLQAHTTEEGATQMWQLMRIAVASPHNTGKCNTKEAAHANCHCKPTQHRKMQRECGSSCELSLQAHTTQENATRMWQLMRIAVASPHNTGRCNANVAAHARCCRKPIRQRRVQQKGGSSCELPLQAHTTQAGATQMWQFMHFAVASPYDRGGCNKKEAAHANCCRKPTQQRKVQRKCGNSCTLLLQAHTTQAGATQMWQFMHFAVASPYDRGGCNKKVAARAQRR